MGLNEPVKAVPPHSSTGSRTQRRWPATTLDRFQAALDRLRGEGLEGVAFSLPRATVAAGHAAPYFPRLLAAYTYLAFHEYGWPALMPRRYRHRRASCIAR